MAFADKPSNIPPTLLDACVRRRIATDAISDKTLGKQPLLWTHVDVPRRPDGDPYGNRTRVSAVKGPRPDR